MALPNLHVHGLQKTFPRLRCWGLRESNASSETLMRCAVSQRILLKKKSLAVFLHVLSSATFRASSASAPTPRGSQETRAAIANGREGNVEVAKGGRERGGEMSDNNERRERARAVACKRLPWSPRLVAAIVTDIRRGVSRVRVELQMNVRWSSRHPLPPLSQNRRTQDGWGGGGENLSSGSSSCRLAHGH